MRFQIKNPPHRAFDESPATLRLTKAAKQVFLRSGGLVFTIRKVAKEAGMSIGAVQHYYPTRDQLLVAVLECVTNEYDVAYERVFRSLPFNGEARLLAAIDYITTDLCDQQTRQFFFALWSLSCHNKHVAALVDEMYVHHRRNIATFIGGARPAFSEQQCFTAATQLAAMFEGLMIFTSSDAKNSISRTALTRMAREATVTLLASAVSEVVADPAVKSSRVRQRQPRLAAARSG